jgi:hydrogenase maturation protease
LGKKNLILGIGSEILSDDGIGPRMVAEMKPALAERGIEFKTSLTGGMDLLDLIVGYGRVIIIDSIKTPGGKPGSVYHFSSGQFMETSHISSFHDLSFTATLQLGRKMEMDLPDQIDVIAIEIADDMTFSSDLSPLLQKKYLQVRQEVMRIAEDLIRI